MIKLTTIALPLVLLTGMLVLSARSSARSGRVMFEDPLDGTVIPGWRVSPTSFVDHPVHGTVYQIASEPNASAVDQPWAGDETWANFRAEIEVLPVTGGHWFGLDCHVQDNGNSGFNVQFFTFDTTRAIILEAASFEGPYETGTASWKLWPISQRHPVVKKDEWIRFRIDVGESVVNAYINDYKEPVFTVYDMPYSRGGVRFQSYHGGRACLRNFRVTSLSGEEVRPVLEDEWGGVRDLDIIRTWSITHPQPPESGLEAIPDGVYSPDMKWIEAETDDRGVLNLGALFPGQNREGTVFARKVLRADREEVRNAWVSYTDRCQIWCNGMLVFKGPRRGWNDPEANHDCRLKPDHFPVELPLKAGENTILLRSQVTENWGWGLWMRIE